MAELLERGRTGRIDSGKVNLFELGLQFLDHGSNSLVFHHPQDQGARPRSVFANEVGERVCSLGIVSSIQQDERLVAYPLENRLRFW